MGYSNPRSTSARRRAGTRPGHSDLRSEWAGLGRTWSDARRGAGGGSGSSGGNAQWLLRNENTPGAPDWTITFGFASDTPIVGDWDGNGTTTVSVTRRGATDWHWVIRNFNLPGTAPDGGNVPTEFDYGSWVLGDIPVAGDWNGNGTMTIGVVRPDGEWLWLLRDKNEAGAPDPKYNFRYGSVATDKPVVGVWTL